VFPVTNSILILRPKRSPARFGLSSHFISPGKVKVDRPISVKVLDIISAAFFKDGNFTGHSESSRGQHKKQDSRCAFYVVMLAVRTTSSKNDFHQLARPGSL
jgi:hypothetical protein